MDDMTRKMATQLLNCHNERRELHDKNERLREHLANVEHLHKIALDKAYAKGYKAGQQDTKAGKPQ